MGVDYSSHLVVGWPVEIPAEAKDVDDYLSPLCELIGGQFVTEGSSYSGDLDYYITATDADDPSIDDIREVMAHVDQMADILEKAGAKIGPFCIKAVGHIW